MDSKQKQKQGGIRKTKKSNYHKIHAHHSMGDGVCCEVTFHGLQHWYKHLYEHLGWMILAKHHGLHDKVMVYKASIARLVDSIEHKIKYMSDKDKKDDLNIMLNNIHVLKEHADKDL